MHAASYRVGVVTDRHSMDHNPSRPRVPGKVSYEVCTEIGRYVLLWEMWVDFPYLICIIYVGESCH
jgi:hypothetical protein